MVMRGAVIETVFTSGAGRFEGSSNSCSSPTSPLDLKPVISPRRRVLHNSSCDEVVSGRGIGLGIIVNMDKSCESKAILLRPSCHVNADIDYEEEEYTIVTRHHKPKNNNSYLRKEVVYDNCGDEKLIRSLFDISPTPARVVDDIKAVGAHFLSTCHECNKQLYGKEIYMYRGEKAFCSIECRSMEIAQMEKEESMKKKTMKRNNHDCVTRHHKPNNNNSYTRKQLVYENCGDHEKQIRSLFDISPIVDDIKAAGADFLSTCHECNKQLHGRDIYMYRGEKAFCSIECRSMEIAQMEKEESMKKKMMMKRNNHDCGSSTSYAPQQVPVSRSSGHGQTSKPKAGIRSVKIDGVRVQDVHKEYN
uniref:FLZ-type domain-containing protein n=1 Tax=Tanacetum cinerariifolium TaxID=118510 RepID=A0A6L2KRS2_TANCI|nr:hypothetical protein [Tanacetum cinerariifolium]